MTFWRDWGLWLLIVVASACFIAGGFPHWSAGVDPATGDKISELKLGLWFSPAYEQVRRDYDRSPTGKQEGASGQSRRFGWQARSSINWLSWSSLALVIGLASLAAIQRRVHTLSGHQQHAATGQSTAAQGSQRTANQGEKGAGVDS